MKTIDFILPSHFASAFINADCSGLSDEDNKLIDNFVAENVKQYGAFYCINADVENTYFSPFNDMTGMRNIGCDVCTFTFDVEVLNQNKPELRQSEFTLDGEKFYQGYTMDEYWNGFACPYFTLDVAQQIINDIEDLDPEEFNLNPVTIDNMELCPLGAFAWVWEEKDENDI